MVETFQEEPFESSAGCEKSFKLFVLMMFHVLCARKQCL